MCSCAEDALGRSAAISQNSYDTLAYPSTVRPESHPLRLGALAKLIGRDAAPFGACRVLEIGGGDGSNLIAMAMGAPQSEFLSFDLAAVPTRRGQQIVAELGLRNVQVVQMDIMEVPESIGTFDYVIAHGVYAWVPEPVRVALMALVGRVLSPRGIAFISYNAMPAGHHRRALRDLLLHHVSGIQNPVDRVTEAKTVLAHYVERWSKDTAGPAALLEQAHALLKKQDAVMFHDELGDCFEPQLITDVVAAARREGLDYLCDAQLALASEAILPGEKFASARHLAGDDFAAFEQVRDFTDVRGFRQSVFCRRGETPVRQAAADRVSGLWMNGRLEHSVDRTAGSTAHVFKGANGFEARTDHVPLVTLLKAMRSAYPASIPLGQVTDNDLAALLVQLAVNGAVDLTTEQMPFVTTLPARPKVSALARSMIVRGETEVPTLRHNLVRFTDQATCDFISLMDGSRTSDELARMMNDSKTQIEAGIKAMMEMGLLLE